MLWKVQISLRQKLGLAVIFSITVIIMIIAIIRAVLVSSLSHQPDQTWLYTWCSVEQTVCKFPLSSRCLSRASSSASPFISRKRADADITCDQQSWLHVLLLSALCSQSPPVQPTNASTREVKQAQASLHDSRFYSTAAGSPSRPRRAKTAMP